MKLISTLPLLYNRHKIFALINDLKSWDYLYIYSFKTTFILAHQYWFSIFSFFWTTEAENFLLISDVLRWIYTNITRKLDENKEIVLWLKKDGVFFLKKKTL